jgi:NAD(P)-dependent dehydrogenase (short-subunit alcohol dehydrogenase family)
VSDGRHLDGDPFEAQRLDGRVLVVTGGTHGLGAAIAARAARLGAAGIIICGRDARRGEAVRRELETLGCDAAFVSAELAEEAACRAVIAACDERFGRLDGLVNAAGLSTRGTLDDTSVELWDRLFAVNVRAPFILMQEGARLMRRAGGGSIVNIITMASHGGEPVLTAYAASKGALATLTRNAGYQLQPDRIRVNGLNIGWTATEGEHAVQTGTGEPDDWLAAADAGAPFGRLLRPEDIAPMVTYLLSDAAAMVTGSVIDFDQTVHGPAGEHVAPAQTGVSA